MRNERQKCVSTRLVRTLNETLTGLVAKAQFVGQSVWGVRSVRAAKGLTCASESPWLLVAVICQRYFTPWIWNLHFYREWNYHMTLHQASSWSLQWGNIMEAQKVCLWSGRCFTVLHYSFSTTVTPWFVHKHIVLYIYSRCMSNICSYWTDVTLGLWNHMR